MADRGGFSGSGPEFATLAPPERKGGPQHAGEGGPAAFRFRALARRFSLPVSIEAGAGDSPARTSAAKAEPVSGPPVCVRMRCFAAFLLGVLCGAGCGTVRQGDRPEKAAPDRSPREVTFTPASWPVALKADLYGASAGAARPGVLLIYGGSWSAADHRWQMRRLARKLAQHGFVVMNATYRGAPEFHFPAPVEDLRAALRWMRGHAEELGLAPNRLAAYGFSAGGHLAELLGTEAGPPEVRVQAVVAASAPSDLTLFGGGPLVERFLGATLAQRPELYREASPVNHVSADDPPFFLYQGTDDKTVSPAHSRAFKAALDRAGVRNELFWVEGRGHGSILLLDGGAEERAIAFLEDVLR